MEEIKLSAGSSIEKAVGKLLEAKEQGIQAFVDFNKHMLYSDNVTLDSAYLEITGKTKEEYDAKIKKDIEETKRREQEHENNMPLLISDYENKGKEILDEEYLERWNKVVPIRLADLYHGMELDACLKIIKILNNNGTLEEARQEIDSQDHSGMSYSLVKVMVKEFCKRGNEFFCYLKNNLKGE